MRHSLGSTTDVRDTWGIGNQITSHPLAVRNFVKHEMKRADDARALNRGRGGGGLPLGRGTMVLNHGPVLFSGQGGPQFLKSKSSLKVVRAGGKKDGNETRVGMFGLGPMGRLLKHRGRGERGKGDALRPKSKGRRSQTSPCKKKDPSQPQKKKFGKPLWGLIMQDRGG